MERYSNISKEVLEAIENFESQFREPIRYVRRRLFVSLYALQPSAREDVLSILGEYCEKLSELLSNEEISVLQKEYREVMRYCVSSRGSIWGTKLMSLDYPIIPYQVVDLCTTIISPASGSNVLLPYSCPEMFAYLSNDCKCDGYVYDMYGYETSSEPLKEWALSQIMAEVFNVDAQIRNCRFNADNDSLQKQYDYILAFPPIRVNSNWISDELTLLTKDFLKENGEMFCFLPYEFTCKLEWENLRKTIIDACFEIKVITLRTSMYRGREICVIHLKKTHTGNIKLVDGTQLSREINFSFSSTTFEAEYLIEAIERDEGKYVWHGEAKDIKDYDLRPAIYLMKLPIPQEGEKLIKMGDLVEVIEDDDISFSDEEYPIIKMTNLATDYLKCDDIELDTLENSSKGKVYSLCGNILLFTTSVEMRVARLSIDNKKVRLGMGIIPMKLKSENVITEEFLLRALTLEETSKQVKSYLKGIYISHSSLSTKDFLKLQILVPSTIEKQRIICQQESRARLSEADRKLLEEQKNFRQDIHMKMHTIGQTLCTIGCWWDILQSVRKEGKGVVDDKAFYDESDPICVPKIYEQIQNLMSQLDTQIHHFDRGYKMVPEDFALTKFIENYIKNHPNPLFTYEKYDSEKHYHYVSADLGETESEYFEDIESLNSEKSEPIFKEGDPIEWVTFPSEALCIIFDNIISNACAHGFSGRENCNNRVKIELLQEGTKYVITIANNGKPPHPQFTENDVFTYGATSQKDNKHYGIGGYEVRNLMREFKGDAEIILSQNEEYTIAYRLIFTDTNIEDTF